MFIRDVETNEQYYFDLYDKWWHYPLLGLSWFFPHKAYLNEKPVPPGKLKIAKVSGVAKGLAVGAGYIFSGFLRSLNTFKMPEEYYWLGPYFAYIFLVISLIVFWKLFINYSNKNVKKRINYDTCYHVRIKFYALDAIIHCYWKLFVSFIFAAAMSESIKYDFLGTVLIYIVCSLLSLLGSVSAGAGGKVIIVSKEGKRFKTPLPQKEYF